MSADTPRPVEEVRTDAIAKHGTAVSLWIHLDQARHATLYNYLMGSTILLLAWATVFSSASPRRQLVLLSLAGAGVALSAVSIAYSVRANSYVKAYDEMAQEYEKQISPGPLAADWPFHRRGAIRTTLPPPGKWADTKLVLPGVPLLFLIMFLTLLAVSTRPAEAPPVPSTLPANTGSSSKSSKVFQLDMRAYNVVAGPARKGPPRTPTPTPSCTPCPQRTAVLAR